MQLSTINVREFTFVDTSNGHEYIYLWVVAVVVLLTVGGAVVHAARQVGEGVAVVAGVARPLPPPRQGGWEYESVSDAGLPPPPPQPPPPPGRDRGGSMGRNNLSNR